MKGKNFVNFLAYLAIALVAIALVLQLIFQNVLKTNGSGLVSAMNTIAQCIAYAITAIFAFSYAKSKKNIGIMVAYIAFVVLIVVMLVFVQK